MLEYMKKYLRHAALLILVGAICSIESFTQGRIPMLGEQAPSFKAETTMGEMTFPDDFGNHWKILFSHPKDFTPVCTSEILELAIMQQDFEELGVKLAIISTDDLSSHFAWKELIENILGERGNSEKINFPLIDDGNARISNKYGMLHAWENQTRDVRGVFIIDPENNIKSINFYPMNVGRNFQEIKRVVTALQVAEEQNVLTPANWNVGDDVLMKHVPYSQEELQKNPALKEQYYKVGINMWYKRELASNVALDK
jgi:peroxiredoxin (alkyl hydroperoxide reductase subunit C)